MRHFIHGNMKNKYFYFTHSDQFQSFDIILSIDAFDFFLVVLVAQPQLIVTEYTSHKK